MLFGLDIGGTKITAAAVIPGGDMLASVTLPTPATDYATFLSSCQQALQQLILKTGDVPDGQGVGVCLPGMILPETGEVIAGNLPCLRGHNLSKDLSQLFEKPVFLANDANCFALSEAMDGAGKGAETVFGAILGTGVGGGLVVRQQIVKGPHGVTGEWGHLPLPWWGPDDGPIRLCGCGRRGCIETHISGPAFERLYADATAVFNHFCDIAAKAFVVITTLFDPDIIVLGGGVGTMPGFSTEIQQKLAASSFVHPFKTRVLPAQYGASSGVRGAAWLSAASK
jgi:fructokinase